MELYALLKRTGFRFNFIASRAGMKPARLSEIMHGSRPARLHERIALAHAVSELAGIDEQEVKNAIDSTI